MIMKNKTLISLLILIICIGAVITFFVLNSSYETYTISEIMLETNGGVSSNWEYVIADPNVIGYKEKKSVDKNPGSEGGKIEEHYIFEGLKEGKTTIKFKYINFITNKVQETKTYYAEVDKDLNITISERK